MKVRPVLIKDVLFFQCETHKNRQVFHENYEYEQALHILTQDMELFRQMQIETKEFQYTVLVSKKGKVTVQKKRTKGEKRQAELSHNRTKKLYFEGRGSGSVFTRSRSYDGRWEGCPE